MFTVMETLCYGFMCSTKQHSLQEHIELSHCQWWLGPETAKHCSKAWYCKVTHCVQQNRRDHDWLIQTPMSKVQRDMYLQPDVDTKTHTPCVRFSAGRAADVVYPEHPW